MATVEHSSLAKETDATPAVLTLEEAANYLRLDKEKLKTLVREHGLPGRQIDDEWRFSRDGIQDWLKESSQKENILKFASRFKDDPYLEEITEEIYRARGRSIVEMD